MVTIEQVRQEFEAHWASLMLTFRVHPKSARILKAVAWTVYLQGRTDGVKASMPKEWTK